MCASGNLQLRFLMAISPWQRRVHRAQELIEQHKFAGEILGFYIHVARYQENLHHRISGSVPKAPSGSVKRELDAAEVSALVAHFESFLSLVEERGPKPLSGLSQELRGRGPAYWSDLLNCSWTEASPSGAPSFLALAFLQPYAELLRSSAILSFDPQARALCPFCRRKPGFGAMRQMGEGAARSLVCGFCLTEWDFRRLVCPGCGEENDKRLSVFTAGEFAYIRVECCDSCKTYIKTIDLTKNGHAEPLVDELAFAPLDLWAQERGFAKLQNNLMGM
jgi:FdhE protein